MKYIIALFTLMLTLQANAALVNLEASETHYNAGELISISLFVDNTQGDVDSVFYDLSFNELLADYLSFDFYPNIDFDAFAVADLSLAASNVLEVTALWFEDFVNPGSFFTPSGKFELGQAHFLATSDLTLDTSKEGLFSSAADIPEPASLLIMLAGIALLAQRRMKKSF